ncbi:amidohydrolase family protein [Burkholderia mayonis]|uniref:Amidohydrolase n=1 Tax=Burkholderia mayonis TaxID=1385591 RepID=A0A1B4FT15_9BURK|nr:amidohydrolase family protein [Burkholderia mayonis]AOJ06818.1 amidohydrolase [Burkholderia mayonis]KVE57662.1 amidohydrolase [Burkholderia mayonis]
MQGIVFSNVRVYDGSTDPLFAAQVRVEGNRITHVARADEAGVAQPHDRVYSCRGATLMPGLVEAHAHLSWPSSVEKFVPGMALPLEDLVLTTARNARILLDHGFTSAYSAGSLSKRVEVALVEQIDSGAMPGPRLVASSIERTPPVAADEVALNPGEVDPHGAGPDAVRAFVRSCAEMGARSVKFLLSGEDALQPGASQQLLYSEDEAHAAGEEAAAAGVWLAAHAQAAEAIKMALRNGFRVLYHCTYADEEALDMLEAARDRIFVAPAIGIIQATLEANPPPHFDMSHMQASAAEVRELQQRLVPQLRARGVRVLPGGDYGFPFNPNGRNARDLQLFVELFGYTPLEALHAATSLGGELMGMEGELGRIRPGYLADLLLVDGDPSEDVAILQDKSRFVAIMKDGRFHKAPEARA